MEVENQQLVGGPCSLDQLLGLLDAIASAITQAESVMGIQVLRVEGEELACLADIAGRPPLSAIRARFVAGEPVESIANDYGVPGDEIEEAIYAIWPTNQAA